MGTFFKTMATFKQGFAKLTFSS